MKNSEWYCSVDVETNGPIPGDNSMLSLGAAAFLPNGKMIDTFYVNFKEIENSYPNKDTMEWWEKNKEAYEATRQNTVDASQAIGQFVSWVNKINGKPVFVGYPATFDFMFVYHYIIHFGLQSPFSFSALDIKTYAMAVMKTEYRESTKKNMPKRWFSGSKHTHVAVDDAIEQGELFIAMLKENTK
jgi:DNA polymerase III alpha subunit (gram-positive type)